MKRLIAALAALLPLSAFGACIPSGVTDQYVYFVAVDSTDFTTRETGLSTWTVYRSRNGGAAAAFTTPTINETDSSNMPGVYELLMDEDTTLDAGDDVQEMALHITHAGMAPVTRTIEICRDKITAGQTVTAANGAVDADAEYWNGTEITNSLEDAADVADAIFAKACTGSETADTWGDLICNDLEALQLRLTAARAGYIDNINGHVAQSGDVYNQLPGNFADLSITSTTGRVDVAAIAGTAQTANDNGADLATITGSDGVTLATTQGNYAPATASALSAHDAKLDTVDGLLDDITDGTTDVEANVKQINDVAVTGDGSSGDKWGN